VSNKVISVGICKACGADIRAESLFCYNCGGKVHVANLKGPERGPVKPERNGTSAEGFDDSMVDSTSVPRTSDRTRRMERKRVNVAWEKTDGPGYLFLLVAAIIGLIVVVMLALAFYLN
jgi:hypothetical protein